MFVLGLQNAKLGVRARDIASHAENGSYTVTVTAICHSLSVGLTNTEHATQSQAAPVSAEDGPKNVRAT